MSEEKQQRTLQQNKALHKYFMMVAKRLNDAGLDMRRVLKPEISIPWETPSVKEHIWKPVQEAMLKKQSTKELTTDEVTKVYEVVNRFLAENHGITEPFPSIEQLMEWDEKQLGL